MRPGDGLGRGLDWIGFTGVLCDEFEGEVYADAPEAALAALREEEQS